MLISHLHLNLFGACLVVIYKQIFNQPQFNNLNFQEQQRRDHFCFLAKSTEFDIVCLIEIFILKRITNSKSGNRVHYV
jgi:hypothetical protein